MNPTAALPPNVANDGPPAETTKLPDAKFTLNGPELSYAILSCTPTRATTRNFTGRAHADAAPVTSTARTDA